MDVVMHWSRLRGKKELYPRNIAILEFVHLGTDSRNFICVAPREHNDRRSPMFERGDRYRADCHHLADVVHVRAAPSINSAWTNQILIGIKHYYLSALSLHDLKQNDCE